VQWGGQLGLILLELDRYHIGVSIFDKPGGHLTDGVRGTCGDPRPVFEAIRATGKKRSGAQW